ncbi:MAG TPA: hypothetical protein ENN32_04350 [Chloroflexi bacterium]|nr:hypothetical protein [Chloroflexota bacterium]
MKQITFTRMKSILLALVFVLGALFTVLGAFANLTVLFIASAVTAVLWLAMILRGKTDLHTVFFILFVVLILYGAIEGIALPWLAVLLVLNLAAWNLGRFEYQLSQFDVVHNQRQMEDHHLKQLGLTLAAGFFLAILPSFLQLELPFVIVIAAVLGFVFLLGAGMSALAPRKEKRE